MKTEDVAAEVVIPKDIQLGDAGRVYQQRLYDECITAGWDASKSNTFAEEIAHLHEELSEAFRCWRLYKDFQIRYGGNGKPEGIPIELADVLIGLFYNAELHGFDLFAAVEEKHRYNLTRNYVAEGRQLHPTSPSEQATTGYGLRQLIHDEISRALGVRSTPNVGYGNCNRCGAPKTYREGCDTCGFYDDFLHAATAVPNGNDGWTTDPPAKQGWYWHTFGDGEPVFPISVLKSGGGNCECFVSMGQLGLQRSVDCEDYGGYWMRMVIPSFPSTTAVGGVPEWRTDKPTHCYSVVTWIVGGPLHCGVDYADVGIYNPDRGKWQTNNGDDDIDVEVSHWQPLPPPPKAVEKTGGGNDENS